MAKRINQLRKQQKATMSRTKDKDAKQSLKRQHDSQIKSIKTSGQSQIKQLQKSSFVINYERKWSDKYKSSIDCDNPKGFSQKAHCQGRNK
mgnify:FL=1